jgi:hypothetical protein
VFCVFVIGSCALLSAVLAIALSREVRLRQVLEALLFRLLKTWRNLHGPSGKPFSPFDEPPDDHDSPDSELPVA